MSSSGRFVLADCQELQRKQLLPADVAQQIEQTQGSSDCAPLLERIVSLQEQERDGIIARILDEQNQKHGETIANSDLVALAAGGALGALNAWLRPTPPKAAVAATQPKQSSIWASALDAAQASLNVVRQRRMLEHFQIKRLSGDPLNAEHVLFCINGFMTQSVDPIRNWHTWCEGDPSKVVIYAVLWEAGDADVWNEFCSHVNDKIQSDAASASAVLTHFTGNPWHKAQDKAVQVGAALAQLLAAQPTFLSGRKVSLMGHSLGGAVIYNVFRELARLRNEGGQQQMPHGLVTYAICLAGAFVPSANGLARIGQELSTSGKFVNVFSRRDTVLSKLFWAIQVNDRDPIAAGCAPIQFPSTFLFSNAVNVEVTELIPPKVANQFGHSYGPHMDAVLPLVTPHLSIDAWR